MELYCHLSASIGKSVKELMDATGFKRSLVFKYLKEFKSEVHVETRERGKRYLSFKTNPFYMTPLPLGGVLS